ncbi:MAG: hypothetical protein NUV83_00530 [Candidatus Wolfebacteria bacterium]|nr:hypothetical protein [Candidatus Wolfebacteria bacterium]
MKKTLIIIGLVIIIAAVGVGVYFGWKKSKEILTPAVSPGAVSSNLPSQAVLKLKALSNESAVAYWADSSLSSLENIFYLSSDGKIFKTNQNSEDVISDQVMGDVKKGEFSADGKFVSAEFSNLGISKWNVFDLENKKWLILPGTVTAASFSSDGGKIAYLQNNLKGYSDLFTNDIANLKKGVSEFAKKQIKILSLNQEDLDIKWISSNKVLLVSKMFTEAETEIWAVDLKTKNISKFLAGSGLILSFSKFGDLGIEFSTNSNTPKLSLIDGNGIKLADFGFYTFPQKCFIAGRSNIFCAVPNDQTAFGRVKFVDDYFKRAVFSNDDFIQLDLNGNKLETVAFSDNQSIDANSISFYGNKFLFINRYDNRLYSLAL